MRIRTYLAATAATALAAVMAISAPAMAATPVFTVGSLGGTPANVGDQFYGTLKSGTHVTLYDSTTGTNGVKCAKSEFWATLVTNPTAPGTATETLDSQTFTDCTSSVFGVLSVKSVTVNDLPYDVAVDSAKVATITPRTDTYIQTTAVLNTLLGQITCVYRADGNKLTGWVDNADNSINFSNQKFNKYSGPGTCFSVGYFSAHYAPVVDVTQSSQPIFTN